MFRRTVFLIAVSMAAQSALAPAAAAPIDCRKAQVDVEQVICSRPELLAQDEAMSKRLAVLQQQCPVQKKLLVQGQKFWLRERWDCRNGEGAIGPQGNLAACLAKRMDKRLQELNAVPQGCDLSSLAATYRFVDVGYMRQFSRAYVGKRVSIFGSIRLDACRQSGASSLTGSLVGSSASQRFPVRFSAMSGIQKESLCAEPPVAHWNGVVKADGHGTYLYLNDLLGSKLGE